MSVGPGHAGRVGLDLAIVNLTGGGLSGGYLKYLRQMMPLLRADSRVRRLHLVLPPGTPPLGLDGIDAAAWPPGDGRRGYRMLREHVRRLAPDVVFIPTARWLHCGPIPTVVMVRNMEPLTVPFGGNSLLQGVRNLGRAYAARVACRRAARVLAVSQHVRGFLVTRWRVRPEKIGVVYHGVEPLASSRAMVRPKALDGHDPAPFVFTAGSIRPARGLDDVIRAMAPLGERHPTLGLVIAGQPDHGTEAYRRRMERLAEKLGVAGRIVWAGHLTPPEMAWCFDHGAVFVTSSRAEACPNTALEALSHGCAIVSTRQPPMPEFLTDVALYYEPGNAGDLAAQVGRALAAGPDERQRRGEAARARARGFQWRETAEKTLEQLALAVTQSRPTTHSPGQ